MYNDTWLEKKIESCEHIQVPYRGWSPSIVESKLEKYLKEIRDQSLLQKYVS